MTYDQINNANHRRVGNCAMAVVDALQHQRPEDQLLGMCAAFVLACEHQKIDPREAFRATGHLMKHGEQRRRPEFAGVAAYIAGEWKA